MNPEDRETIMRALTSCGNKKLRGRIQQLLKLLNFFGRDLRVGQSVNAFYYMQKDQELETLEEQLDKAVKDAMTYYQRILDTHADVMEHWKIDFVNLRRAIGKTQDIKEFKMSNRQPNNAPNNIVNTEAICGQ